MALEVGQLVAYLRLDDAEFQRTLSKSGTDLRSFGQSAQRLLQPAATAFTGITTAGAATVGMLLRQGVAYNTLQQQSRAALKSITGSAEEANKQMDALDEFARNSPFSKATFITAQQQMLGFGIESKKVIPYLDSIQNGVAAIGGSNQQVGELAYIMAQISAAGKITGQDLMQFGQRGINAAKLIGDQMGMTEQEIRESITKGTLDADEALDALAAGMSETYEGAAAGVKETWIGATDRVRAATRDLGSTLAAPFVDPQGGGMALAWANGLADLLRAIGGQAGPLVNVLLPRLVPLSDAINRSLQAATIAVKDADVGAFVDDLGKLGAYATPLAAASAALFAMGTNAAILARVGLTLNPFVAALVAVVATSEDARTAAMDLVKSLAPLEDEFGNLLRAGGDLANTVLDALVGILVQLADGADSAGGPVDLLAVGLDALAGGLRFVNTVIEPVAGWLVDLAGAATGVSGPIAGVTLALIAMRNVDVSRTLAALTTGLSNAKGTWQASQATLQALGREAGVMNTAMLTARTGVQRLGGALKGFAVSNAPMLAITALAAAIGFFVQESAKAEAAAESLAATFDDLTGAATAETDQMILSQLNEQLDSGDWERLRQLGYDTNDLVDAVKRGEAGFRDFNQANVELKQGLDTTTKAGRESKNSLVEAESVVAEVGRTYGVAADEAQENARAQEDLANATEGAAAAMSDAERDAQTFNAALEVLSDEASSADEKLRALQEIMDIIAGKAVSASDAAFNYADTVRDTTKAVEDLALSQEDLDGILNDDGSLNVRSEAAARLRGSFQDLSDDANSLAVSLAEAGDVEGVSAAYDQLNADIDALGEAAGLSDEQVNALKLSLGILPTNVMTDIVINGTEANVDINRLGDALLGLPTEVVSAIYGDTSGLDTAVDHAGLQMAYVAGLSADPMIGADDSENLNIVAAATARLNEIDAMEPTPELRAEKKVLENVVAGAKLDLNSVPDKTARVTAETYGFGSVEAMKRAIRDLKSKTVTLRTQYVTSGTPPGRNFRPGSTTAWAPNADGNVWTAPNKVLQFANGAENHVAQIAPAGAWRVWAEDETGGEAYIPLGVNKRNRSLAIMHDVAARFGHVMIPVNAQRFADGASGSLTHLSTVHSGPGVDEMAVAFAAAVATLQPVVQIGERQFVGAVQQSMARMRR